MTVTNLFRNRLAWCIVAAMLALLLLLAPEATFQAGEDDDTREARIGELLILKFPGNRDSGYRWRLNKEGSRGLDIVEVRPIGWTIQNDRQRWRFSRALPVMSISVLPKAAGQADIAFDYYRVWAGTPQSKTKIVRIVVKPDGG